MMKQEFEDLTGWSVTDRDFYEIIEPMYMSTTLTKKEFVKSLNNKRFDVNIKKKELIRKIKRTACMIRKNCDHFVDVENEVMLDKLIKEYSNFFPWECNYSSFSDGTRQGCSYPREIVIYRTRDFVTVEKIIL